MKINITMFENFIAYEFPAFMFRFKEPIPENEFQTFKENLFDYLNLQLEYAFPEYDFKIIGCFSLSSVRYPDLAVNTWMVYLIFNFYLDFEFFDCPSDDMEYFSEETGNVIHSHTRAFGLINGFIEDKKELTIFHDGLATIVRNFESSINIHLGYDIEFFEGGDK